MSQLVVAGASLKCSMGTAPSQLAIPSGDVSGANQRGATVQDYMPNVNVKPFAMCTSTSNPQVASAKSPQPCVPVIQAPWTPGSATVNLPSGAALTADSKCSCQWSGVIEVDKPGQTTAEVG